MFGKKNKNSYLKYLDFFSVIMLVKTPSKGEVLNWFLFVTELSFEFSGAVRHYLTLVM